MILVDPLGTQTQALTFPCVLINLDGISADAGYLQVFDLAVAPTSTSTVPLMSMRVTAGGPLPSFFPALSGISLSKGLYIAMSSTDQVYTAVATAFDVFGAIDEYEVPPIGVTAVGNFVSAVTHLQVWADSAGPKKLVKVIVTNLSALTATRYLQLFAKDSPTDTSELPIAQWTIEQDTSYVFNFGSNGSNVVSQDNESTTTYDGCTLWMSSTSGVLTKMVGDTIGIKAFYK